MSSYEEYYESLTKLKRPALQHKAKQFGVKANATSQEIIRCLMEKWVVQGLDSPPKKSRTQRVPQIVGVKEEEPQVLPLILQMPPAPQVLEAVKPKEEPPPELNASQPHTAALSGQYMEYKNNLTQLSRLALRRKAKSCGIPQCSVNANAPSEKIIEHLMEIWVLHGQSGPQRQPQVMPQYASQIVGVEEASPREPQAAHDEIHRPSPTLSALGSRLPPIPECIEEDQASEVIGVNNVSSPSEPQETPRKIRPLPRRHRQAQVSGAPTPTPEAQTTPPSVVVVSNQSSMGQQLADQQAAEISGEQPEALLSTLVPRAEPAPQIPQESSRPIRPLPRRHRQLHVEHAPANTPALLNLRLYFESTGSQAEAEDYTSVATSVVGDGSLPDQQQVEQQPLQLVGMKRRPSTQPSDSQTRRSAPQLSPVALRDEHSPQHAAPHALQVLPVEPQTPSPALRDMQDGCSQQQGCETPTPAPTFQEPSPEPEQSASNECARSERGEAGVEDEVMEYSNLKPVVYENESYMVGVKRKAPLSSSQWISPPALQVSSPEPPALRAYRRLPRRSHQRQSADDGLAVSSAGSLGSLKGLGINVLGLFDPDYFAANNAKRRRIGYLDPAPFEMVNMEGARNSGFASPTISRDVSPEWDETPQPGPAPLDEEDDEERRLIIQTFIDEEDEEHRAIDKTLIDLSANMTSLAAQFYKTIDEADKRNAQAERVIKQIRTINRTVDAEQYRLTRMLNYVSFYHPTGPQWTDDQLFNAAYGDIGSDRTSSPETSSSELSRLDSGRRPFRPPDLGRPVSTPSPEPSDRGNVGLSSERRRFDIVDPGGAAGPSSRAVLEKGETARRHKIGRRYDNDYIDSDSGKEKIDERFQKDVKRSRARHHPEKNDEEIRLNESEPENVDPWEVVASDDSTGKRYHFEDDDNEGEDSPQHRRIFGDGENRPEPLNEPQFYLYNETVDSQPDYHTARGTRGETGSDLVVETTNRLMGDRAESPSPRSHGRATSHQYSERVSNRQPVGDAARGPIDQRFTWPTPGVWPSLPEGGTPPQGPLGRPLRRVRASAGRAAGEVQHRRLARVRGGLVAWPITDQPRPFHA